MFSDLGIHEYQQEIQGRPAHFIVHGAYEFLVVIYLLLLFSPILICCRLYPTAMGYAMLEGFLLAKSFMQWLP